MNFETSQRCGTCPLSKQNKTRITFKFSAKITHIPGILTPGDFNPDRSGGHVVPRWKSPDVMVGCEFGWKSPVIMVSV